MKTAHKETVIPNKLYFKIGEVAEIVGVKPYVLRYWETEFPDIKPSKSKTNQRLYRRKEVEWVLKVRDLLYKEKYTINGAKKKLKSLGKEEAHVSEVVKQMSMFDQDKVGRQFLLKLKQELEGVLDAVKQ